MGCGASFDGGNLRNAGRCNEEIKPARVDEGDEGDTKNGTDATGNFKVEKVNQLPDTSDTDDWNLPSQSLDTQQERYRFQRLRERNVSLMLKHDQLKRSNSTLAP